MAAMRQPKRRCPSGRRGWWRPHTGTARGGEVPGGLGGLPASRSRLCRGGSVLPAWSRPVPPCSGSGAKPATPRGAYGAVSVGVCSSTLNLEVSVREEKKSPMNRTELHKQSLLHVFYAKCRGFFHWIGVNWALAYTPDYLSAGTGKNLQVNLVLLQGLWRSPASLQPLASLWLLCATDVPHPCPT